MPKNKKKINRDNITAGKILLDDELDAFLTAIPNGAAVQERRESLILKILINTGIRVSELCDLRCRDCPPEIGGPFIEVYRGKRGNRRNIPVDKVFADEIEDYVQHVRPDTMPKRYAKKSREGWLFYNRGSKKLTRFQVRRIVERTARNAGIHKHIHVHMLRHVFASYALRDGIDINRLKKLLGHRSLMATEKYLNTPFSWDEETAAILNRTSKRSYKNFQNLLAQN